MDGFVRYGIKFGVLVGCFKMDVFLFDRRLLFVEDVMVSKDFDGFLCFSYIGGVG